jgi:hypothetical protein
VKTRRQGQKPSAQPKSEKTPLAAHVCQPAPSSYIGAVKLAVSMPNPVFIEEKVEQAPKAEVVQIKSPPSNPPPKAQTDDSVALTAWLEAYAGFPDYEGFAINRMPQHRVERKLQHRKNGAVHVKRTHVLKEFVTELLPGDHFGDPTGRRHQTEKGYPTRDLYEKQAGESQYHRKTATGTMRAVVSNDSSYKGPHWSPSMSTQRATEGFEKCKRPPSFA